MEPYYVHEVQFYTNDETMPSIDDDDAPTPSGYGIIDGRRVSWQEFRDYVRSHTRTDADGNLDVTVERTTLQ